MEFQEKGTWNVYLKGTLNSTLNGTLKQHLKTVP
jgi:hypothetical protein